MKNETSGAPIRVLHAVNAMNLGGAESMIMNLYRAIDRSRVQFDFLVHIEGRGAYDAEIESLGGRIFHLPRMKGYDFAPYYLRCVRFFQEHEEISVVHGHIGSCAAFYLAAAKKCGKFTIAHSHSVHAVKSIQGLGFNVLSFPTRYIADQLFACSQAAGAARFGAKATTKANYMLFHNAVPLDEFAYNEAVRREVRQELGIGEDQIVIGTVGRISAAKNPQKIAGILGAAVTQESDVVGLWCGDGDMEERAREMVGNMPHAERIIMTGRRNDVGRVLQAFDGFILPSLYEGMPVSGVEAQAAGLPCLFADTISDEAAVSPLAAWMKLDSSDAQWAAEILHLARANREKRESPMEDVKRHGYDIHENARWLADYYLRVAQGKY